ncbi:hypothetical protein CSA08_01900 [Candidatus Gracilibacteria bacterium]|nr:MAG: hypothetical protein CSA08_01900 [Candidatus Gracilibacteria bacterium]
MLNNFGFTSPEYFLLIIPFLLFLVFVYKNDKKDVSFLFLKDLKSIYPGDSYFYKIKYLLIFVIFILFLIIMSNPVKEYKKEVIKKYGIDIEIILDISPSMMYNDLIPNRLEVAKDVIINFLDKIEADRVGVIVFAGKPFTSIPLTYDYNFLKEVINKIDINIINQNKKGLFGTAIGDALVLGNSSLKSEKDREKVIILLTDGKANQGLDPLIASKLLKENNIKVYSVGIGRNENYGGFDKSLLVDEETLKKISKETSGKYFRADTNKTFRDIFDEISLLEKTEIETEVIKKQEAKDDIFLYFLIFSIILLSIFIYKKG